MLFASSPAVAYVNYVPSDGSAVNVLPCGAAAALALLLLAAVVQNDQKTHQPRHLRRQMRKHHLAIDDADGSVHHRVALAQNHQTPKNHTNQINQTV